MINIVFTVISLGILTLGVVAKSYVSLKGEVAGVTQDVEESTPPLETESPIPTPSETPTPSLNPTLTPSPVPSLNPTPTPNVVKVLGLSTWSYPNARITLSGTNTLSLESSDNADVVTAWYKNEIKQKGYGTTSVIQTSTNGRVINKIVAAKSNETVTIEITKDTPSSPTIIKITQSIETQNT